MVGLLIAAGVFVYGNRVVDFIVASRYTPTSQIAAIHDSLKLTGEGTNLLYASMPLVQDGQAFNAACASTERTQAILGCYGNRDIYIYNVTNPELTGAMEVTSAHEMLHAAYDRLNILERPAVDKMLREQYDKLKSDSRLTKLITYYEQAEPDAIDNELHSILGTTIANLSPQLEAYYERYFTDRQAIVVMNQKYTAVFESIDAQAKQLAAQIDELKPRVEQQLANYQQDLQVLNQDIVVFNSRVTSGAFSTQSEFDAARLVLVSRSNNLNAWRDTLNGEINQYNVLVAQQNKLSVRTEQLNSSINAAPEASGL